MASAAGENSKRRLSNLGTVGVLTEVTQDEYETTNFSPFGVLGRRKSSVPTIGRSQEKVSPVLG